MTDRAAGAERGDRVVGEITLVEPIAVLGVTEAGLRTEGTFALQNDSLHEFRLSLGSRLIVVKGRVARCEIGELKDDVVRYRCDVEFVEPSPHVLQALREFVAANQAPPPVIDGEIR